MEVKDYAHRFPKGHWSFQELNKNGMERTCKLEGQWNRSAEMMMLTFRESGHPVLRATNAWDRRLLRKTGGKLSFHFSGDAENAELSFRMIKSANQLSIYGAVAEWLCGGLAQQISAHASSSIGKPSAQMNEQLDCQLAPEDV